MTILFQGSEREAFNYTGTTSEDTTSGRFDASLSRASMQCEGSGVLPIDLPTPLTDIWVHFYGLMTATTLSFVGGFYLQDGSGNTVVRAGKKDNGNTRSIQYYNGSSWVEVGTWSDTLYLPCDIHVDLATGTVEVYIDSSVRVSQTGLNLSYVSEISKVIIARPSDGSFWASQVMVADESTLQFNLKTVPPSAVGTDTDASGLVTDVNEVSTNTSTYMALSNAGDRESFVHSTINVENYVQAVTVSGLARRVDGTGPQNIRPYLILGGVRYFGDTFPLTTSFETYQHTWNLNPATNDTWLTSEVNNPAFEMGWEAVA